MDSGLDLSWPSASDRTHSEVPVVRLDLYRSSALVVLALILGLLLGALIAWVAAGRRLSVAESALAGTRAELHVERRSFDDKVVNAVRAASADAYQANSSAFLEIAESKLTGYVRPLKESLEKVESGRLAHSGASCRS